MLFLKLKATSNLAHLAPNSVKALFSNEQKETLKLTNFKFLIKIETQTPVTSVCTWSKTSNPILYHLGNLCIIPDE